MTTWHHALTFVMSLLLLTACGSQPGNPTATPAPVTDDDTVSIGLLVGVGGIEDGGFNELSLAGVSGVSRRLGASFEYLAVDDSSREQELLDQLLATGEHDIVVTVGFELTDLTASAADQNPDIHFVGIDQFQADERPNLTGIIFPNDQAGYLAGYLAGTLTETDRVGGIYGPEVVEPVRAFAAGYRSGAQAANENVEVLEEFHPAGVDVGFSDIEWGRETAAAQLDAGADVIFTAAGDTGRGALVQVANQVDQAEDPLYCIGVDTDQWQTVAQARSCLVSSAVKAIPAALDEVIVQVIEGNPPSGNYLGPVGLAPYHDFSDVLPDEVQAQLEQLTADLTSGVVMTGYTP